MTTDLVEGLIKSLAALRAIEAVPSEIKITSAQFDALKRECECRYPCDKQPSTFEGIRIVIDDRCSNGT